MKLADNINKTKTEKKKNKDTEGRRKLRIIHIVSWDNWCSC